MNVREQVAKLEGLLARVSSRRQVARQPAVRKEEVSVAEATNAAPVHVAPPEAAAPEPVAARQAPHAPVKTPAPVASTSRPAPVKEAEAPAAPPRPAPVRDDELTVARPTPAYLLEARQARQAPRPEPLAATPKPPPVDEVEPVQAQVPPPAPTQPQFDAVAAKPVSEAVKPPDAVVAKRAPEPPPVSGVALAAQAGGAEDRGEADVGIEVEEGTAEIDLEGLEEEGAVPPLPPSVADLDAAAGAADDDVPISSQRPIFPEPALEDLAFGDAADAVDAREPTPTAPPESGRQSAGPPTSDSLLRAAARAVPEVELAVDAAPTPAPPELTADVTRPAVAAGSPAVFRGAPPVFRPASFDELLDATLAL